MRLRDKRFGIALLLLACAACDDDGQGGAVREDDAPALTDDDVPNAERDASSFDAGTSPARDAATPTADAAEDDGDMEMMEDGGRRRRDGGTRDGGARDAATPDAATPTTDAAVAGDLCAATASWDPAWTAYEDEVLRLTNDARAKGATCGSKGAFPAVKALAMEARLRCAARLYSKEMVDTDNFSHTSKDGTTFDQRINKTGYKGRTLGENIAAGYATPAAVVAGWLKSEGHCTNIMSSNFTEIGIGYYITSGAQAHWTQDFGKP